MSQEMPLQQNGAPLQYCRGARVRAACLSAALIAMCGCAVGEHKQEPAAKLPAPPPVIQPLPPPAILSEESPHKSEQAEIQETAAQLPSTTGQTAWAQGFEGDLILGLDGELYIAYNEATIKHVQSVMKNRGLYAGPVNGVLDPPTMESIYMFQEANIYMLPCGVPTPRTRKLLEQGSHTDITS